MSAARRGKDVVIVGGGIYGASLAYDLATSGCKVTLLEAGEIAAGASGGAGERGVRASNRDIRELPIVALAQRRWTRLQTDLEGGLGYRRIGGLHVFDIPYGQRRSEVIDELEARAAVQQRLGVPTRLLTRDEALSIEPELSPGVQGAIYCPDDGVADHSFATRQLASAAEKSSAKIRSAAKVDEIVSENDRAIAVKLSDGERITVGDELVLLANSGIPRLLRPFLEPHETLPVWTIIPQMLFVTNPEKRKINHLIGHRFRKLSLKQLPDDTVMISGGWGLDHGEDGRLHGSLTASALNISDAVATFPFLDRSAFLKVDGSRIDTCSIDHIPIIGRPANIGNLLYAFAWSGHGFAISLGFSKYLTDWITSGEEPAQLAPFSPRRFQRQAPHI